MHPALQTSTPEKMLHEGHAGFVFQIRNRDVHDLPIGKLASNLQKRQTWTKHANRVYSGAASKGVIFTSKQNLRWPVPQGDPYVSAAQMQTELLKCKALRILPCCDNLLQDMREAERQSMGKPWKCLMRVLGDWQVEGLEFWNYRDQKYSKSFLLLQGSKPLTRAIPKSAIFRLSSQNVRKFTALLCSFASENFKFRLAIHQNILRPWTLAVLHTAAA